MTIETKVRCDRCNKYENEFDEHWMRLVVHPAEEEQFHPPEGGIHLCGACEADFTRFMTGEVFHRFMEKQS